MDGRSRYNKLVIMMEELEPQVMHIKILRVMIMKNIGGDERTINSCLKIMAETGMIRENGNSTYEIRDKKKWR